ncbi:hypothetical protein JS87_22525 [Vibrio vulnificus]|uniref:hypothetical protein n=1 Tax=Vibrio vulnificus TaxID=672 RepID=UPI0005036F4D|nr:hypothetical protein [Vibrio vulnificus]ELK2254843.1 hypothetical protein [Vibrio vulnificus]KFK48315.1 hypothetical protein JS87_22525 [Vibrio vulnificus]RZQ17871.1 hypothetical protein D8T50_11685 [Vibrio vulnificus]HAS6228007.1 hypothetical protein [Vibrio vulnificus]
MTWITLPSVSVQNGSKIVTVNNTQTTHIKVGDALLIGNYQPVEIAGVFATQLSLRTNWSNAAQTNASAVVLPTFGDFNAATQALRQATQVTQGNFKTLEDWGTKLGNITFEGQDNSKHTARTLLQMDADVSELEEQANNLIVSLSGLNFALSKAIVDVLRSGNKEQYAASGFIHYGRARGGFSGGVPRISINEGMWSSTGSSEDVNTLNMGQVDGSGSQDGALGASSKTHYPVLNIAGFTSYVRGINGTTDISYIKFPEAPNGTVVSDSSGNCRGTGKPTLDLSKEVDPKYGDVADSVNEAVARAFEGIVRDGDLRNGAGAWIGTGSVVNNEIVLGDAQYLWQYTGGYYDISSSKDYVVEVVAADIVGTAEIIIYADTNKAASRRLLNGINVFTLTEFTQNFGGTTDYVRLATSSGSTAKILSVSLREVTEEVVTDRVDMAGLEFFKEKVGAYLYPYGMIQSKATTVDGVATTEDTVRPITYFAVFEGDTTSRGRGWKLADLTFVQLATIMSNPEHNAWYNEAGELMQFRGRQRSFAGLGNGDWRVINPKGDILSFGTENLTRVAAQGRLDTPASPSGGGNFFAGYTFTAHNAKPEVGMFTVSSNSGDYQAPDGECYFYVLATVPRLNQGAYHQSFNPMGTKHWNRHDASGGNFWHQPNTGNNKTTARAFYQTIVMGETGARQPTGAIGQNSGRGDGRLYDAIYASGQGGVIDWRLPARDMSSKEEAAKVFQKVVNGTYRGIEKLKQTLIFAGSLTVSGTSQNIYIAATNMGTKSKVGDTFYVVRSDNTVQTSKVKNSGVSGWVSVDAITNCELVTHVVLTTETDLSVSGNFTQVEVIGSPERIFSTPALTSGWVGRWCPVIPNAGDAVYKLTHKCVDNFPIEYYRSQDNGTAWEARPDYIDNQGTVVWNSTLNAITSIGTNVPSIGEIGVATYTSFATQTKSSVNKLVLNGSEGIGDVWASSFNSAATGGCLLAESMLGKVLTSNNGWPDIDGSLAVQRAGFTPYGALNNDVNAATKHTPLTLAPPSNDSPAVKALWHQASNNQQATLNFLWNELIFDTNWRTPDKVWSGGSVSVAVGETFRAESSSAYAVAGLLMRCVKALTANATVLGAMHVSVGGDVISLSDGQTYFKVVNNGWSDDSTIRMIDGVGTFNNENGDTCLYGTDELSMPYGYTKNQAGAGKQVVGVDL